MRLHVMQYNQYCGTEAIKVALKAYIIHHYTSMFVYIQLHGSVL